MDQKKNLTETPADDIRAGRPERYYDYVYKTYGKTFRSGSVEVDDDHIVGPGAVGVWTKSDSVTAFDDFSYGPATKP